MVEATTKGGKTVGAIVWQAHQVLTDKLGRNHWWVAPVYPQSRIAYRRCKRMFRGLYTGHNDTDLNLTFPNGAVWWFKTGEKPDNLYGEDVASAVFDEFTRCRHEAWIAVRSTLTATRAPARFIGNVKGRANWGYKMARLAESEHGNGTFEYHRITADDVPADILSPDEVLDAQRTMPPAWFRELYYCEPADDEGNPFSVAAIHACRGEMSTKPPVCCGVDLAKSSDWTWVVGIDEDGRQCISERWQSDWGATRTRILALVNGWPTLIDSTGVGDPIVEDLARVRPNITGFRFDATSKQRLMDGLRAAIQTQAITIADPKLIAELEAFEYRYTRNGVKYEAPAGLHDDGVCALALAVQQFNREAHRPRLDFAFISADDEGSDAWGL